MLHFYLFSIIPILYIYSQNIDTFPLSVLILPLVCILSLFLGLHIFIRKVFKNQDQGFLFFSCFSLLFWFSWRIAVRFNGLVNIQNNFILTYKFSLLTFTLLLSIIVCYWTIRTFKFPLRKINVFLNVFSFSIFSYQALSILIFSYQSTPYDSLSQKNVKGSKHPNIYHIILDAYTNKEILSDLYNYNNDQFYTRLKDLDFDVSENAYSNYPATFLSVNSMLRGRYFYKFSEVSRSEPITVWEGLRSKGYMIRDSIGFVARCNYPPVYLSKADHKNKNFLFIIACFNFTPIHHTLHNLFLKRVYQAHIDEIDDTLLFLENAKEMYGVNNNYFYAHIVNPHEPFVFDAEGNVSTKQTYEGLILQQKLNLANNEAAEKSFQEGYTNQIQAINKRVLKTIEKILSEYPEDSKPIIIIHGDHGRSSRFISDQEWLDQKDRDVPSIYIRSHWGILLAVHGIKEPLPQDLTLINLYKYVFNNLFFENNTYLDNKHFSFTQKLIEYESLK